MVRWKSLDFLVGNITETVSILLLVDGALEDIDQLLGTKQVEGFNPTFGGWCAGSNLLRTL